MILGFLFVELTVSLRIRREKPSTAVHERKYQMVQAYPIRQHAEVRSLKSEVRSLKSGV